ncbi:MAG TPA: four helix bundle protein [Blastocatellia bacterium]
MSPNVVLEKSYQFALRIVRLYKHLSETKKEYMLSKRMLDTGTSVGAFVKAAQEAESKPDFFHEMNAALKMATKTEFWLELLHSGDFLDQREFDSIHTDCEEMLKLLKAITKPTRRIPGN